MKTCNECGQEYKRDRCPHCIRLNQWETQRKAKVVETFSPRIQRDLNTIDIDPGKIDKCLKALQMSGKDNLFITGPVGSGKTLFTAALTIERRKRAWIDHEYHPHEFISVPALYEKIKATFHSESESDVLQEYIDIDWLVLDDIGVESSSDWSYQTLYYLINSRYENLKTTIFTSNLSLSELADKWEDARIPSRINGSSEVFRLDHKDWRTV